MTPNAPAGATTARHPRTIAGVVLAFLGAIALTIGITGSPVAGLDNAPTDYPPCEDDPYCLPCEDDPYCVPCEDDPYCYPTTTTTTVPDTTTTTTTIADTTTTTTTTVPDTTTTTTTIADTTTTTTTTVPDTTTTTTTIADTTTTSTSVAINPPTTTTTTTLPCEWDPDLEPDDPDCYQGTTTSVASGPPTTTGTGSNSPTTVLAQLPRTGPEDTNTMLVLGALLLLVGGVMVLSTRRENELV